MKLRMYVYYDDKSFDEVIKKFKNCQAVNPNFIQDAVLQEFWERRRAGGDDLTPTHITAFIKGSDQPLVFGRIWLSDNV